MSPRRGATAAARRLPAGRGAGLRFVAFAAVLAAGLTGACSETLDPGPPMPIEPAALYAVNCARCHGADGRGDPEIRKTLPAVRDFTDPAFRARATTESIEAVVMRGRNAMPPFGGTLSAPKIQSLAGYVKRLGAAGDTH